MLPDRTWVCRFLFAGLILTYAAFAHAAGPYSEADLAPLNEEQRDRLTRYLEAREEFARESGGYWDEIKRKRAERQRKRAASIPITPDDYAQQFPPVYSGPPAPADVLKLLEKPQTTPQPDPLPAVPDFLRHAKEQFGFVPERVPEDEFMRRYATAALSLGFTPEQIVRVYALETGGLGTHDMQSGFNPVTKKGRPISTALGYAQLLDANTIEVLNKEGPHFAARLEQMAVQNPAQAAALKKKAAILRKMHQVARKVGINWHANLRFGKTPKGQGIHSLNLDGHIGPWLQVNKLQGIREFAVKHNLTSLSGGQLELLNLAGPSRGLEMLQPYAQRAVTANFFERQGYERNPMVHNKTAAQLVAKIEEIMDKNMQREGARRFMAIFAELRGRAAAGN